MKAWLRIGLAVLWLFVVTADARDIVTRSGKIYRNATVVRVEKNGLDISYEDGVAFIDFKDLPEAVRMEFGFNELDYTSGVAERQATDLAIARARWLAANEQTRRRDESETQRLESLTRVTAYAIPLERPIATRDYAARDYSDPVYVERSYSPGSYTSRDYSGGYSGSSRRSISTGGPVFVRSYTRKDGTFVHAHTRSR